MISILFFPIDIFQWFPIFPIYAISRSAWQLCATKQCIIEISPFPSRDFRSETRLRHGICRFVSHATIRYNAICWLHYGLQCWTEPPLEAIRFSLPIAQVYRERRQEVAIRIRRRWLSYGETYVTSLSST